MKYLRIGMLLFSGMVLCQGVSLMAQTSPIDCDTPQIRNVLQNSLRLIEKLNREYGALSTQVADEYYRIATYYCDKKCLPDAIRYHKKALAIREKCLGLCHKDTVESYREIGHLYRILGDLDNASRYHAKAMKATQKAFCEVWGKR